MRQKVELKWLKFGKFIDARDTFKAEPCVYVQANSQGKPIRIGQASSGLESRYRGGTGYALEAAMHSSGNLIFVAGVPNNLCKAVEIELIWRERDKLVYNTVGKNRPPEVRIDLEHVGAVPVFSHSRGGGSTAGS